MTGRWERVCPLNDVPTTRPLGLVIGRAGTDRVCVLRRADGEYVVMLDRCPHRDIALSGGIVRDDTLVCPGHFWQFDLRSGERTDLPEQRATIYPHRVVDGWLQALLPAPQPQLSAREWLLAAARAKG